MKKYQKSVRLMIETILNVLSVYTPVWSSSVPTSNAVQDLKDAAAAMDKEAELQSVQTKGYTRVKLEEKTAMANVALDTSRKVCAYATDINDPVLFGKMKFSFSKLYYTNATDARIYAENIYKTAVGLPVAILTAYGIDPTQLQLAIVAFNKVITMPRNQIVIKKSATGSLADLTEDCRDIVDNRIMNMMSNWRESNPEFYTQMTDAKKILDSTKHTTIEGVVTSNGVDLKNVKVTIASTKFTFEEMTNFQGRFKKQELNPDLEYSVTFELNGYQPKTIPVDDLKPGGKERLTVQLVKVVA